MTVLILSRFSPFVNVIILTMNEFEHYPPDTWAMECDKWLTLIKQLEDGHGFAYVIGSLKDPIASGVTDSLTDAQAKAHRWCWLVNNVTQSRAEALISKL